MNILNFSSRAALKKMGLSEEDVQAFIDLRTREGELQASDFETPLGALSERGALILQEFFASSDESDGMLSRLSLEIGPASPLRERAPGKLTIFYHGDIDKEFREFSAEVTLRGPNQVDIYDISASHVIEIEVTNASGETLGTRFVSPQTLATSGDDVSEFGEAKWNFEPPLGAGENWGPDGVEIYARLFFDTRGGGETQPFEVTPLPTIHRAGRFQVLGQPDFRFDPYNFAIGFPAPSLFTELSSIFDDPAVSGFRRFKSVDPALVELRKRLSLEPGKVDFEGLFEFGPSERALEEDARPENGAPGWIWMLTGPEVLVGYEPDSTLYAPRGPMIITIPGADVVAESGSVPYNITERSLLDRPELFGSDPGSQCQPFDQPGRVLGERRFYTAMRVTQPYVEGSKRATLPAEDELGRPLDFPRNHADFFNEIQYEPDRPDQYMAKTVAIGHVIESAVRYRSNGYSLGDIAYSLTLAPRQKRRIVKLDWTRSESSTRVEDTLADDEVADQTNRTRDYENVVSAELGEWARGRSRSSTTAAAAGMGFAAPGFVAGGGAASSTSNSSSSSEGGRNTAARETQALSDAIRRWGESTRSLQSTVIQESEQSEEVEGVSEVIQNINYTRSLSVIYYEILRHIRIDTEVAGVSECVYVPLPVRPFTPERIRRHKDVLRRYTRGYWERMAFKYLDFLPTRMKESDLPGGPRAGQNLTTLSGSIYITMGIGMPGEGEVAQAISEATDKTLTEETIGSIYQKAFGIFTPYMARPVSTLVTKKFAASPDERNRYFQREIAPDMARRFLDELVLEVNGTTLAADFTLATPYRFGRSVRVDFTVDMTEVELTRVQASPLTIRFNDSFMPSGEDEKGPPERRMPAGSYMNATRVILRYANDYYEDQASSDRGARDLLKGDGGEADPDGAMFTFRLTHADKRDLHKTIEDAFEEFQSRLEGRPYFYHKAIWWNMDRDALFTLLDGYAVSNTDKRSLASVIRGGPSGIVGNSLVFRTNSDTPLDPKFDTFEDLKNHYVSGLKPRDPMRISLPTEGVYARAHLDGCVAAEEHNGSFDWVFDNQEPELADLPDSMFASRRAEPQNMTPSQMPTSIINLQNAPEAPEVSGLDGVLGAVQNAGAFRDMAGLAGTQANTRAGLQAATSLATSFGTMAFQSSLAQMEADAKAGKNMKSFSDALNKMEKDGSISPEEKKKAGADFAKRQAKGKDPQEEEHRRELEKKALDGEGGGTVTTTDKDGTREVKKNPEPKKDTPKKPKPNPGYVKWLPGPGGIEYLLLYNFKVGDKNPKLHPQHIKALNRISVQIKGVDDIFEIEGRASKTRAKGVDEETAKEINKDLSIARMTLVWNELMKYAFDPQSNLQKQKYPSENQPVRDLYRSQLAKIDDNNGEDPVERSVLIKLARKVDPKPDPKPVPVPKSFGDVKCEGHTLIINDNRVFYQGDSYYVDNSTNIEKLVEGQDFSGATIEGLNGTNFVVVSNGSEATIEHSVDTNKPGETKTTPSSKATTQWQIDFTKPRGAGTRAKEGYKQIQALFNAVAKISETLPEASGSIDIKLGSLTISNVNLNRTIAAIFKEISDAVLVDGGFIEKTLNGLVIGAVEVDVKVTAKAAADPNDTDRWQSKTFTLTGEGAYYGRAFENSGVTDAVRIADYTTSEALPLSAWGARAPVLKARLHFSKGSFVADARDLLDFLTQLTGLLPGADLLDIPPFSQFKDTVTVALDGIDELKRMISLAAGLIDGESLEFEPEGETKLEVKQLESGRTITLFKMDSGTFRAK